MSIFSSIYDYLERREKRKTEKKLYKKLKKEIHKPINRLIRKKIATVHVGETLGSVVQKMVDLHKGALVVFKDTDPIGVISEFDFLNIYFDQKSLLMKVEDIIKPQLLFVSPQDSLHQAHLLMIKNRLRKILVMQDNTPRGIVTQTDILKEIFEFAQKIIIDVVGLGNVRDVMTKDVVKIQKGESVEKARQLMQAAKSDSIIVMDKEKPVGIVTTNDVVNQIAINIDRLAKSKIDSIMSSPIATISPEKNVFSANRQMLGMESHFQRMPVMFDNKMIGIVTQTDISRGIFEFIRKILDIIEEQRVKDIQFEEFE